MENSSKQCDMYILRAFIKNNIPSFIREQTIGKWDLMECYEELFNYSHCLLAGHEYDISVNSLGTGRAFVFDKAYKDILLDLSNNNDDINLKIHCYLCLTTLLVIQKYSK